MPSSTNETARRFELMKERIERNEGDQMGGCFVIIPPRGDPVEVLIMDPAQSASQFWGLLSAKVAIELTKAQDQEAQERGMYGRR